VDSRLECNRKANLRQGRHLGDKACQQSRESLFDRTIVLTTVGKSFYDRGRAKAVPRTGGRWPRSCLENLGEKGRGEMEPPRKKRGETKKVSYRG